MRDEIQAFVNGLELFYREMPCISARNIAVFCLIGQRHGFCTVKDIAARLGINDSQTRAFLHRLREAGLIEAKKAKPPSPAVALSLTLKGAHLYQHLRNFLS